MPALPLRLLPRPRAMVGKRGTNVKTSHSTTGMGGQQMTRKMTVYNKKCNAALAGWTRERGIPRASAAPAAAAADGFQGNCVPLES